jgi:hypothetical protein
VHFALLLKAFAHPSNHVPSSRDQLDYQYHKRCHEQQVNEPAKRVRAQQAHKPKQNKDHEYCPKHRSSRFSPSWQHTHWTPSCAMKLFGEDISSELPQVMKIVDLWSNLTSSKHNFSRRFGIVPNSFGSVVKIRCD